MILPAFTEKTGGVSRNRLDGEILAEEILKFPVHEPADSAFAVFVNLYQQTRSFSGFKVRERARFEHGRKLRSTGVGRYIVMMFVAKGHQFPSIANRHLEIGDNQHDMFLLQE
jgi:hypothetical protein